MSCSAISSINFTEDYAESDIRGSHDHPANPNDVEKIQILNNMKKMASNLQIPIRDVISSSLARRDMQLVNYVGTIETLSRFLRRFREGIINPKPYIYNVSKL